MITSRIFLVPMLTSFLVIIPFGVFVWIMIVGLWYIKNQSDIHDYFRGRKYRFNEVEEEYDKLLR